MREKREREEEEERRGGFVLLRIWFALCLGG